MSLPGDENPNPQWQRPQAPQWQSGSPLGGDAEELPAPQWQQAGSQPNPGWVAPPRTPGQAYGALIFGIIGIFPICPVVLSIGGLILGYMAKGEIDRSGGQLGGAGIALAGIIVSWVGIGIYLLLALALYAL